MKSSITQIERRFDISSSVAGVIDGGFEIGKVSILKIRLADPHAADAHSIPPVVLQPGWVFPWTVMENSRGCQS